MQLQMEEQNMDHLYAKHLTQGLDRVINIIYNTNKYDGKNTATSTC